MDWRIGDFAFRVTPGSKLEDRVVMVISKPLVDPGEEDVVYWVHPGFPDRDNWGWGPRSGTCVQYRIGLSRSNG